jgi:phosphoribosyl-AMP cyclohydrolase
MPLEDLLHFDEQGLIPVFIFDSWDNQPLTLCYMDRAALAKTLETGLVHVFRRSMGRVMLKGETSGHTQQVSDILVDCEGNSLAIAVEQNVAACHAGYYTCYFRRYNRHTGQIETVGKKVFDPDKVY